MKRFEERRCTDIFWLLLFIGFWVGMFVVCGIAFDRGGTDRLFYGTDSYGFLCGSDNSDSDLAKPVLETEAT